MRKLYLVTGFLLLVTTAPAHAFFCANCGTEWTQMMNNIQLAKSHMEEVKQTVDQVKMIQNQINMIRDQAQNSKNLARGGWGDAINQLENLNSIARDGEGLAFSSANVLDELKSKFKGYDEWNKQHSVSDLASHYRQVSRTLGDTANGAMQVASQVSQQQAMDNQVIDTQQRESENASGRLQAIQAGNKLTAQCIRQLQKLETLLNTQIQLSSAAIKAKTENDQMRQAQTDRFNRGTLPLPSERKIEEFELKDFTKDN